MSNDMHAGFKYASPWDVISVSGHWIEGKGVARTLLVTRDDDDGHCIYIYIYLAPIGDKYLDTLTPLPEGITLHYCVIWDEQKLLDGHRKRHPSCTGELWSNSESQFLFHAFEFWAWIPCSTSLNRLVAPPHGFRKSNMVEATISERSPWVGRLFLYLPTPYT